MENTHDPEMRPITRPDSLVTYVCIEGGNAVGKGTIIGDMAKIAPWLYEANTPGYPNIRSTYEPTDDVMRHVQKGSVILEPSYRRWLKEGESQYSDDPLVQAAVFLENRHYQQRKIADGSVPDSLQDPAWSSNAYKSICDPSWFADAAAPPLDLQKTVVVTDRGMPSTIVYQLLKFYQEHDIQRAEALSGMIRSMYEEGYLFPYDLTIVVFPIRNGQQFCAGGREKDQFEGKNLDPGYYRLTESVMKDPYEFGFRFTDTICWVENDFTAEICDVILTTLVVNAVMCASYRESLKGKKLELYEEYSLRFPVSMLRDLFGIQIKYHQNINSEKRKMQAYHELLIKGNPFLIGNVLVRIDPVGEKMSVCLTTRIPGE